MSGAAAGARPPAYAVDFTLQSHPRFTPGPRYIEVRAATREEAMRVVADEYGEGQITFGQIMRVPDRART